MRSLGWRCREGANASCAGGRMLGLSGLMMDRRAAVVLLSLVLRETSCSRA